MNSPSRRIRSNSATLPSSLRVTGYPRKYFTCASQRCARAMSQATSDRRVSMCMRVDSISARVVPCSTALG
jgi:hypothetical protein